MQFQAMAPVALNADVAINAIPIRDKATDLRAIAQRIVRVGWSANQAALGNQEVNARMQSMVGHRPSPQERADLTQHYGDLLLESNCQYLENVFSLRQKGVPRQMRLDAAQLKAVFKEVREALGTEVLRLYDKCEQAENAGGHDGDLDMDAFVRLLPRGDFLDAAEKVRTAGRERLKMYLSSKENKTTSWTLSKYGFIATVIAVMGTFGHNAVADALNRRTTQFHESSAMNAQYTSAKTLGEAYGKAPKEVRDHFDAAALMADAEPASVLIFCSEVLSQQGEGELPPMCTGAEPQSNSGTA